MYLLNILITFCFSLVNIVGSIFTGRIPKASMWQCINGNVEIMDKAYWYNNDVSYMWRSKDELQIQYNSNVLDRDVDEICALEEMEQLTTRQKAVLHDRIKEIVVDYNRIML